MSKLTKTMIASALAVAVAGPAAADEPYFFETFVSDKALKVKISGGNCKTTKFDFATSMLVLTNEIEVEEGFEDLFDFEEAGFWGLEGFTWAEVDSDVFGIYTTKKIDKDLTASMYEGDVGGCLDEDVGIGGAPGVQCAGLAEAIQTALIKEGCGAMTLVQSNSLEVTKSDIKFSKKGDRAKVDFKVEGTYVNTKGNSNKEKKVKLTIKGKNYDRVLAN